MIDGEFIPENEPIRVLLDDGLVRGDGVFEGIRSYGRRPRTSEWHLERIAKSGAGVGIPIDVDLLRDEMATFCEGTVEADCAIRLIVTRGGIRIWREEPIPAVKPSQDLMPVAHRVTPLLVGAKTLSYAANMRAQRIAKDAGMDDALCYRADDRVILEGPTWSFAWLESDQLAITPLDAGVLDSLTRRLVLEAVPTVEKEAPIDALAKASGGFVISSVQEIVPVRTIFGIAAFDPASPRVTEVVDAVKAHILTRVEDAATA